MTVACLAGDLCIRVAQEECRLTHVAAADDFPIDKKISHARYICGLIFADNIYRDRLKGGP